MELLDRRLILSPSDLINHQDCGHLTGLDLGLLTGELVLEHTRTDAADLVARKGDEHEAALLDAFWAERPVTVIDTWLPVAEAQAATFAATRAGEAVNHEATLGNGIWRGYADFVERVERPSGLGDFAYESADTTQPAKSSRCTPSSSAC